MNVWYRNRSNKTIGTFFAICLAVFSPWASPHAAGEDRPNIIFIMADDLGYNDLGAYGQTVIPTPNTDQLARQGVRLTSAYSPSSVCSPTRYAVLTGTDPFRRYITSHVLFNAEPLVIGSGELTVATLLEQTGYATGVFGKWHLGLGDQLPRDLNQPGRGPKEVGFVDSFIVPDGHNMYPRYYHENGIVVGGTEPAFKSHLIVQNRVGAKLLQHQPVGVWESRRPDHEIGATLADRVDAFIQRHADRPFFLYYATCAVHSPLTPDDRFQGTSGIGPFGDFVMEFDWAVGRVMAKLDSLDLTNNTLLIVTSDNGGLSPGETRVPASVHRTSDPWRGQKASHYEGGHRVPFLARWPGRIEPGSISDSVISLVDLTATAAALVGASLPAEAALDSFDMLPALQGKDSLRPYTVTGTRGMTALSIRQGDWKLTHMPFEDQSKLVHLGRDPQETTDLAADQPQRRDHLQSLLDDYFLGGSSRPGAQANGKTLKEILAEREERNDQVDAVLGLTAAAEPTAFDRSEPGALFLKGIDPLPFQTGARIFPDRPYRLLEPPAELHGAVFLPVPLEGKKNLVCSKAGTVWMITPTWGRNQDSQEPVLSEQGFEKTSIPEFPLWTETRPGNRCSVYQKKCEAGEIISFGKWAVPVFFPPTTQ